MKKKYLLFVTILGCSMGINAQDALSKKLRFGIKITPAFNWMTPANEKKVIGDGLTLKAGIGLITEFKITETAWFETGLDYTGAGCKAKYNGTDTAFYYTKDDVILETKINENYAITSPIGTALVGGYKNTLTSRKYKIGYLHIPLSFKFKTKDIGGITYFGVIGGGLFFRLSAKADDIVNQENGTTSLKTNDVSVKKIDVSNNVNLINMAAHFGGGVEYNLSGSTYFFSSIYYQHGILNVTKETSAYLMRSQALTGGTPEISQFQNAMKLRQIVISVGVLF